ncbi:MAG: hypothetical protein Q9220_002021 [cf. Caloplaca sp. 1 TL-2023]
MADRKLRLGRRGDGVDAGTEAPVVVYASQPLTGMLQVINACGMGFVGAEVSNGLGRHKFYLPAGGYKKFLKYDYLDWAQVFATLALSKISICLFLLRLSSFRRVRLGLYALIIFMVTSHVPLFFLVLFQCSPVSKYWTNPLDGPGVCFTKATVETIIVVQGAQPSTGKDLATLQELHLPIEGPRVETRNDAGMPEPHLESKPSFQYPFEAQDHV